MKFTNFLTIMATIAAAFPLTAMADLADSVVKIYSGRCGTEETLFRGSGMLFQSDGKDYVITSDHVVINGNRDFCHSFRTLGGKTFHARLENSDWSVGLALLKVQGDVPGLTSLSSLTASASPVDGEHLVVAGFPYESSQPVIDTQGVVLSAQSQRHFFASTFDMTEVSGTQAEFGMSGGPVFSADKSLFRGILSHQAIVMIPGSSSRITEIGERKDILENHVLLIPAKTATHWIQMVLAQHGNSVSPFWVSANDQLQHEQRIVSAGLEFTFLNGTPDVSATSGGIGGAGDGVGIGGGGDGVGIGGDGVGIGGSQDAASSGYLRVRLASIDAGATKNPSLESASWIKDSLAALQAGKNVTIPYLVRSASEADANKRIDIISLAQFFHKINDLTLTPVVMIRSTAIVNGGQGSANSDLHRISGNLRAALSKMSSKTGGDQPRWILDQCRIVADLLDSSNWASLSNQRLQALVDGKTYAKGWDALFESDFYATVDVMSALNEAVETLQRLKGN